MRIILYQAQQNAIGGIETFNLNFCKRLSKYYDILFVCDIGDEGRLEELRKYVDVEIYNGQYFECDLCIFSSAWGKRPIDHISAKKYVQMVHADFQGIEKHWNFSYKKLDGVTEHWAGGDNIAKTFEERYGEKCKVIHYLLRDDIETKPVLHLITTSRIAKEKGFHRVVKLAKILKQSGRKFNWDIWGDGFNPSYVDGIQRQLKNVPEVSFRGRHYNLESFVADADYSVQLSDTEGYAFSIAESLQLGTPVIATNFPNAYEQITEGKNGYIVDMELTCVDDKFLDKLYNKIPKFEYEPISTEEDWIKMIGKPSKRRSKVKVKKPKEIRVKIIAPYFDMQLNRRVKQGEVLQVTDDRGMTLMIKHLALPV